MDRLLRRLRADFCFQVEASVIVIVFSSGAVTLRYTVHMYVQTHTYMYVRVARAHTLEKFRARFMRLGSNHYEFIYHYLFIASVTRRRQHEAFAIFR